MPFVRISAAPKDRAKVDRVVEKITKIISEEFGRPEENIWVVFEEVPRERWFIGGKSLDKR